MPSKKVLIKTTTIVLKKILFILHYPPPVHGAAMVGQYIRESEVINRAFNCQYLNLGTSVKVGEIGKGGIAKIMRFMALWWHSALHLVRFRPHLVYLTLTASGSGFYKDALIALLAKTFAPRVVYHLHNKGVSARQNRTFDHWLYKRVFRGAEVILLSEYLYSDIEKYVPRRMVHICPNGIPDQLVETPIVSGEPTKGPINILFLSNLIESKGIYELLEACKALQAKKVSFQCTVVGGEGDITTARFQQRIKELGLDKVVRFLGKKYGPEKTEVYCNADIFAFPTYYPNECFPLVLLEAMQFSLPIVSTFEGGIQDIVIDGLNGYLILQKDTLNLTLTLENLIHDTDLRCQMGNAGRLLYEERFRLSVFEKRFQRLMIELTV